MNRKIEIKSTNTHTHTCIHLPPASPRKYNWCYTILYREFVCVLCGHVIAPDRAFAHCASLRVTSAAQSQTRGLCVRIKWVVGGYNLTLVSTQRATLLNRPQSSVIGVIIRNVQCSTNVVVSPVLRIIAPRCVLHSQQCNTGHSAEQRPHRRDPPNIIIQSSFPNEPVVNARGVRFNAGDGIGGNLSVTLFL